MQGARTRRVESPWACQVILLARTEHTENTEFCYIRAPINAGVCVIFFCSHRGRRGHGVLLYSCADQCRSLRYLFLLAQRDAENTEFCYIRAPINAGQCRSMRNTKRRSVLRLYEYDFQLPLPTLNFLLPTSFRRLPDVKFLFGTDFAADGHCRTNQHQVFDDVLPFESQYHGEV